MNIEKGPRPLSDDETRLVVALLSIGGATYESTKESLASRRVRDLDDGGMGSLRFVTRSETASIGNQIAAVTFKDADSVMVWATLQADVNGELYELDMFKGDFSRLIRIPDSFDSLSTE